LARVFAVDVTLCPRHGEWRNKLKMAFESPIFRAIHLADLEHQPILLIVQKHRISRPTFDMLPSSD